MQASQDLIVAILLGNSHIKLDTTIQSIRFKLKSDRVKVLENFIDLNQLDFLPFIKCAENEYILEQNVTLKRILVDMSEDSIIKFIDPALLNINTYMLWFCLFGEKGDRKIYVSSNIDPAAKKILVASLKSNFDIEASFVAKRLIIHSASRLVFLSLANKRPQYETNILIQMANDSERKKVNRIIENRLEGGLDDVRYGV